MKPPTDREIIEWNTAIMWFDEFGIFCSISKKTEPQSMDEMLAGLDRFKQLIGDRKVCMLADVTYSSESTKEARDFAAIELPKFIKAVAMVSDSPLGKMMANLFFKIKSQPYPTRMFTDEEEARNWLKKYL